MFTSILIQPLNLILFPKILSYISSAAYSEITKMLSYVYIITLLGIVFAYIVSKFYFLDFMHLFFEKGKFTAYDSKMVYQVFLIYLTGAFGMVAMNIQNKVLTALKLFDVQIYAGLLFIIFYFMLMTMLVHTEGYLASGITYAICWSLYTVFAGVIIYKNVTGKQI